MITLRGHDVTSENPGADVRRLQRRLAALRLYKPVYSCGGYAIHGEPYVPVLPVSDGCIRIPMDVAQVFPRLVAHSGIPVYIR